LIELAGKLAIAHGQIIDFNVIQVPPLSPPQSQPTPEAHPAIWFWKKCDYLRWQETPAATTKNHPRGKLPYLEDADGKPLEDIMVRSIHKLLRAGWNDLLGRELAPRKWGHATQPALDYIKNLMERAYPLFKFTAHGWKLDHLITTHYPSWSHQRFGKGKEKQVKMEDVQEDGSEDKECNEVDGTNTGIHSRSEMGNMEAPMYSEIGSGVKRKTLSTSSSRPSKKQKTTKQSQHDTKDATSAFDDPDDLDLLYLSPPTAWELAHLVPTQDSEELASSASYTSNSNASEDIPVARTQDSEELASSASYTSNSNISENVPVTRAFTPAATVATTNPSASTHHSPILESPKVASWFPDVPSSVVDPL
jgi:hypothetical protein